MGSIQPYQDNEPPLLPSFVDRVAVEDPDRIFCISPKGSRYSDGCRTIKMPDFARAINRAARWLEKTLGRSSDFETLAYMGSNDVRYFILILAAVKTGYRLLLPSLRNSIDHHLSVLDSTKCTTLLHSRSVNVEGILKERENLKSVEVPELDWLLDPEPVPPYPFEKTFEQAENEPLYVQHSSGSTGPPKPIVITHGSADTVRQQCVQPEDPDWPLWPASVKPRTRVFIPLPFFHAAGTISGFFQTLFNGLVTIHAPANVALSTSVVKDAVENMAIEYAILPPSLLEEISRDESALPIIDKLPVVGFGGGPLPEGAGDILSKHTFLVNIMGSTEAGVLPTCVPESSADYSWFRIKPGLPEVEFHDRGEGLYELVYVRDPKVNKRLHSSFNTFPDQDEYPSKDLYVKHPTDPGKWKLVSRTDDVIVLSNGEKVVSIPIEGALHEAPQVEAVITLGHGRFQVAALIEPTEAARKEMSDKEILEKIKPAIQKANSMMPGHAHLATDHVLFTKPDKPMTRTSKGTIMRKVTKTMYEAEINDLYEGGNEDAESDELADIKLFQDDLSATETSLHRIVTTITEAKDIALDQDFFAAGVDSLQVLSLVKQLKFKVKTELPSVDAEKTVIPSLVYSNPNIQALAKAFLALKDPDSGESPEQSHHRAMEEMLAKYSAGIPAVDDAATVLLTGSTGSLGSYLLDDLVALANVRRVYALNRATDGLARQTDASGGRGLSTDFRDKVVFLHADLAQERLGLDEAAYTALRAEVTHIVHNQWPVNFNQALQSFEPHVAGVRRLIDLSAAGARRPPILFTSTVATTAGWSTVHPGEKAPERLIGDVRVPAPMGYGESKYVAEHLLAAAAGLGVSAAIVHVGQLAGPVLRSGVWNKQEWLPSLVASSKHLNLIPSSVGAQETIDWVPVDLTSAILLELCDLDGSAPPSAGAALTRVHNLANPTGAPWGVVVRSLQQHLPKARVVDFSEWLAALRKSAEGDAADPVANPAIKLLDFFEGAQSDQGLSTPMETKETAAQSRTMKEMTGVSEDWMEKWMKQWDF